jgi:hypothetical protein
MSKFLRVPAPADIRDPNSESDRVLDTVEFHKTVGFAVALIVQNQGMDAVDAFDLRRKVRKAPVGSILELTEGEHKALEGEFKRPKCVSPTFVLGGGMDHIEAILGAKSKASDLPDPPAPGVASAN